MSFSILRSVVRRRGKIAYCAFVLAAVLAGMNAAPVRAADVCAGEICIAQGWARATPGGAQNAAVYFSIVNYGGLEDTLADATTTAAKQAMIHQSALSGNVVRMGMVGSVGVPPHSRVTLAPRGYHLMLEGLKTPLKEGMTIPVTLSFRAAGKISISVQVLSVAAIGPGSIPGVKRSPDDSGSAVHAHH